VSILTLLAMGMPRFVVNSSLMTRALEEAVAERARRQHGLITRGQLLGLGVRSGAIHRLVAGGRYRRIHSGVYLAGPVLAPRSREVAAVLACGGGSALSHRSGATLRGLTTSDVGAAVDVSVLRVCRQRPGIQVHRVRTIERCVLDGIPVTTPVRTLIDFAAVADAHELEVAVARAERANLVSRVELMERVSAHNGRRGLATLRAILSREREPAFVRSEAESRGLRLFREGGLPEPQANFALYGFELDCYWPEYRTAVELDGYRYHGNRESFERDRRRATILASQGIQVIPITWRQIVEEPVATAVRIAQALLRAEMQAPLRAEMEGPMRAEMQVPGLRRRSGSRRSFGR
jgi:hypothetical protein